MSRSSISLPKALLPSLDSSAAWLAYEGRNCKLHRLLVYGPLPDNTQVIIARRHTRRSDVFDNNRQAGFPQTLLGSLQPHTHTVRH